MKPMNLKRLHHVAGRVMRVAAGQDRLPPGARRDHNSRQ